MDRWVFLLFSIGLLSLFSSGCSTGDERKVDYFDRAQQHFDRGNFAKAKIDVRNALQIDNDYTDARYLLSLLMERDENWEQLLANLNLILETNPGFVRARIKYGTVLLAAGNLAAAEEEAEKAIKLEPKNAEALALRGAIAFRQGENSKAIEFAENALLHDVDNESAITVLTEVFKSEDPERALAIIEGSIQRTARSSVLLLLQIRVHEEQNEIGLAADVFEKLIEAEPDNLYYHYRYVQLLEKHGQHSKAEAQIHQIAKARPDAVQLKLWLVRYLLNHRDAKAAESQIRAYIEEFPVQKDLQLALGHLLVEQNRIDEAERHYTGLVSTGESSAMAQEARFSLAVLANKEGTPEGMTRATRIIEEMLQEEPENPQALLYKAAQYVTEGENEQAVAAARMVLRNEPESVPALAILASAHEAAQQLDLAQDTYRRVIGANPTDIHALNSLTRYALNDKRFDDALSLAKVARKTDPTNPDTAALLVAVHVERGETEKALQAAKNVRQQPGQTALADYLSALVFQRSGDLSNAADLYASALEQQPNFRLALSGLVATLVSADKRAAAYKYLDGHIQKFPENSNALTVLAELHFQDGMMAEAQTLLKKAIDAQPGNTRSYQLLGEVLFEQKRFEEAGSWFERGLEEQPRNTGLLIRRAQLAEVQGSIDQAIAGYEEAIAINNELMIPRNNVAVLYADYRRNERDKLERAAQLMRRYASSETPALLDTLGWVHYRLEDAAKAVRFLEAAIAKGGDDPVMHYHLGMAYLGTGQTDLARSALQTALQGGSSFAGIDDARAVLESIL